MKTHEVVFYVLVKSFTITYTKIYRYSFFEFLEAEARYTAEEACELLVNDENFGEMDSADSLDDSFSDSTTSCSEVD